MGYGPKAGGHAAQDQGVEALIQLAKDSIAVRNIVVNHKGVQSHLIQISEQLRKYWTGSDKHAPHSDPTAPPQGMWYHDLGGAPGTSDRVQEGPSFSCAEPPSAAGQSDALLLYLVGKARDQQGTHETLHAEGGATHGQTCAPEEGVEGLVDARSWEQPRRHKSDCKRSRGEADEPPRTGDTALIVKGIRATCRRADVYAMLEASGFANTFDVLYMPKNFVKHHNRGYFHINFKNAVDAEEFVQRVQSRPSAAAMNRAIGKPTSTLVAYRARYQGLRNFVMDTMSGRKLRADNEDYRPWIYLSGASVHGCPLTKEMAERLLSTESPRSGGAQSSSSNATMDWFPGS